MHNTYPPLSLPALHMCSSRIIIIVSTVTKVPEDGSVRSVALLFPHERTTGAPTYILKVQKEGECIVDRTHRKEVLLWVGKTERTDYKFHYVYSIRNDHTFLLYQKVGRWLCCFFLVFSLSLEVLLLFYACLQYYLIEWMECSGRTRADDHHRSRFH